MLVTLVVLNFVSLAVTPPAPESGGGIDLTSIAAIAVALIAAASAEASRRAARKASRADAVDGSRAKIEEEAFNRAQGFLKDTIDSQESRQGATDLRLEKTEERLRETEDRLEQSEKDNLALHMEIRQLRADHRSCADEIVDLKAALADAIETREV